MLNVIVGANPLPPAEQRVMEKIVGENRSDHDVSEDDVLPALAASIIDRIDSEPL